MAEQTFRSPGFFEQEIELVAGVQGPTGTPGGIIGTSEKGPAFVPVTVGNFTDFQTRFGGLDPERQAPYAAREWLKHKGALTFTRVLGAGANTTLTDINTTLAQGTVTSAGFKISEASVTQAGKSFGTSPVQFICAEHFISASGVREELGFPVFTDNPSYNSAVNTANLVRAVVFSAKNSRLKVLNYDETWIEDLDDLANVVADGTSATARKFKIAISSSDTDFGTKYSSAVRVLTASLDPRDESYVGKILNTDPDLFFTEKHLLYLDFPVDTEVAPVSPGTAKVAILSGSGGYGTKFGRFDTRYTTPRTTSFISQPFGKFEYDLFHFEAISDGEWANNKLKVSISNIIASTDKANPYGTFDVLVRNFSDDDIETEIVERYAKVSLNPRADNYIAKAIGDKKVSYNFDTDELDERRLVISGKYPNRSTRIRVVVNSQLESGEIPASALPFGFRGVPVLKTNDSLFDGTGALTFDGLNFSAGSRLIGSGTLGVSSLTGSLIPPLPFRFKVTRGEVSQTDDNIGAPGTNERTDSRLFWGVVGTSVPATGSVTNAILNANIGVLPNKLVESYTKFQGIALQDTLVTGSAADVFNANKFTLARVALANQLSNTEITGTAEAHMREAAYVRNGLPDGTDYRVTYGSNSRVTLATLVHSSSVVFNRFTPYAKFTNIFYGGFDGLNILDRDNRKMNDRASSTEASANGDGKAKGVPEAGLVNNAAGSGKDNNIIASYKAAVDILTSEFSSNVNVLAIPGIRESLIADYASDATRNFSLALYLRDIPAYDDSGARLWDDSTKRPSVRYTSENFTALNLDNNYVASYFPDVYLDDDVNLRRVKVAPSVATLGAMAFNDKVAYPWFAPAGFNRAALDFVRNVQVRLNSGDRDTLYDARINPIAVFPQGGFVIFGQKNLQLVKSALDRVNVRRLMIEVKRVIGGIANRMLFEQNTPATRAKFVASATPQLALIQAQAGIEKFRVIMDDTNNTATDVAANRVNGRIVVVPTRTVEFIAIDFVITPSGVQFE
jgi:hypothetical protein